MFGLRAANEHRSLQREQFTIGCDHLGKHLRFCGRSCKNWQGRLKHRRIDAKDLKIYAKPELGERCVVSCFKQYLSFTPPSGPFYRCPNKGNPPKFSCQVIGVHTLANIVQTFCFEANFEGYFTNHSGKVTCATQLLANNDEQLIKRQTGHQSDAVRHYKRPCDDHALQVSNILQAPTPKKSLVAAQDSSDESRSSCPHLHIRIRNKQLLTFTRVEHKISTLSTSPRKLATNINDTLYSPPPPIKALNVM